ncbi:unnamed protein product [Cylicocyclus nassatus]|uniref:Uncharacterized protein n=1 Tax=Cylicocyclus nassatus TaxID=53992 RepID=A0AA36HDC9_CYLNA|nr:unnamed protein product [Cylicocyclus nassatus]
MRGMLRLVIKGAKRDYTFQTNAATGTSDSSLPLEARSSAGASAPVNSTFRNEEGIVQGAVYRGTRELSQRKTKEVVRDIKSNQLYAVRRPRQVYEEALSKTDELCDVFEKIYSHLRTSENVVMAFYGEECSQRPQTSRAINTFKDREVTLQNIPNDLVFVNDRTRFVHVMEPQLHIYYFDKTIQCPTVSSEHPAYGSCWEFLNYSTSAWLFGPFEDLWCKWRITDLRTTNLAEAFHNKLNAAFTGDQPDMRTLLEKLRTLDATAMCNLRWNESNPRVDKSIRRRDLERRQSVDESMTRFDAVYRAGPTVAQIEKFYRDMSWFISGKTV